MTSDKPPEVTTVRQLRATWRPGHAKALRCGRCRENLSTTGLSDIVYTFEVCTCSTATYDHLVEQLWHRECFKRDPRGAVE